MSPDDNSKVFAHEVATRILGLLSVEERGELGAVAARLGVDVDSLRATVDERLPRPRLSVIVAVVRLYGVDPSWLLTGDYDTSTHRHIIELDEHATIEEIRLLARRRTTPTGVPLVTLIKDDDHQWIE